MLDLIRTAFDRKEEFMAVVQFYYSDLPNPLVLNADLLLWQTYWETLVGPHPDDIATTLKAVNFAGFENIKVILCILGTLPITSLRM